MLPLSTRNLSRSRSSVCLHMFDCCSDFPPRNLEGHSSFLASHPGPAGVSRDSPLSGNLPFASSVPSFGNRVSCIVCDLTQSSPGHIWSADRRCPYNHNNYNDCWSVCHTWRKWLEQACVWFARKERTLIHNVYTIAVELVRYVFNDLSALHVSCMHKSLCNKYTIAYNDRFLATLDTMKCSYTLKRKKVFQRNYSSGGSRESFYICVYIHLSQYEVNRFDYHN